MKIPPKPALRSPLGISVLATATGVPAVWLLSIPRNVGSPVLFGPDVWSITVCMVPLAASLAGFLNLYAAERAGYARDRVSLSIVLLAFPLFSGALLGVKLLAARAHP